MTEDITVIEILGESSGINPQDVRVRFTGEPFKIPVSEGMLGRILDPFGNPLDELGSIIPEAFLDISGEAYNPSKGYTLRR